jgi:antitoxin component of MazEF toxin-antitoxin module
MQTTLKATLSTWGKSVAIRIPAELVRSNGWQAGQTLGFHPAANGGLLLKPLPKKLNLDELLAQVTDDNLPDETDVHWGAPRGSEVW